jgi:DNA repair exonuclease SbcCD nuclease subunit
MRFVVKYGAMRPVRFIHTSDVHLDTSFSGSGFPSRLGDRKREAIRGTFRNVLEEARTGGVDFILIAGDLFEAERVTPDTVEFLKQQFSSLDPIPIFISPGNHDPFTNGSPYKEESWPRNVHIFDREEFQPVELSSLGIRVMGFGFTHAQIEDRIFQKLNALPGDLTNIVLAHGSDLSGVPTGKARHAPFGVEEIAGKNIAYCALGHYHQQHSISNQFDAAQIWYAGIPEGRGWDEEGPCGYILGEIIDGALKVESRVCSQYTLNSLTIDCDSFLTREQIVEAILQHQGTLFDPKTILRIRLAGSVDPKLDLSISELEERLAGGVLFIQFIDQTHPALDFESIAQEKTLRGRFVRILNDRISAASQEERETLERARLYGVQALSGREVRFR